VLPLKKIKYSVPKREDFYVDYMRNGLEVNRTLKIVIRRGIDIFFLN
jgi:hypothetical protein